MLSDYLQDNKVSKVDSEAEGCVCLGGRGRVHGWAWEIFSQMNYWPPERLLLAKSTLQFQKRQNTEFRKRKTPPLHRIHFGNLDLLGLDFQRCFKKASLSIFPLLQFIVL